MKGKAAEIAQGGSCLKNGSWDGPGFSRHTQLLASASWQKELYANVRIGFWSQRIWLLGIKET